MPAHLNFVPGGSKSIRTSYSNSNSHDNDDDAAVNDTVNVNTARLQFVNTQDTTTLSSSTYKHDDDDVGFESTLLLHVQKPAQQQHPETKNDHHHHHHYYNLENTDPLVLCNLARNADVELNSYNNGGNSNDNNVCAYVPSLSVLAEAVYHTLTGVPSNQVKMWSDAMVLHYHQLDCNDANNTNNLVSLLKHLAQDTMTTPRPCGYVFKRGDMAWNCRTCQTDSTCVLCDACFQASDHTGHEVSFHQTSPGGCCDCGDVEAWAAEGCCDLHRPVLPAVCLEAKQDEATNHNIETDPMEAVRASQAARRRSEESAQSALPPNLRAALGCIIGAAVQAIVQAVDGAAIGADTAQWQLRWAEQIARIRAGCCHDDDYCVHTATATAAATDAEDEDVVMEHTTTTHTMLRQEDQDIFVQQQEDDNRIKQQQQQQQRLLKPVHIIHEEAYNFPPGFQLHLRLHNDDVHTFDEVIDALNGSGGTTNAANANAAANNGNHRRGGMNQHQHQHQHHNNDPDNHHNHANMNGENDNNNNNNNDNNVPLIAERSEADSMTQLVDSDGQVVVKQFSSFKAALLGYKRTKTRGLHCAIISTPQLDAEERARALLQWLTDVAAAHPGVAAMVCHALVDVSEGDEMFAGVCMWPEPRQIPCWSTSPINSNSGAFPVDECGSYMTRDAARDLYCRGMEVDRQRTQTQTLSGGNGDIAMTFEACCGCAPNYYRKPPWKLPSYKLRKSPHALWGTLHIPLQQQQQQQPYQMNHNKSKSALNSIPQLFTTTTTQRSQLMVIDTDTCKHQPNTDYLLSSTAPQNLPGLYAISGVSRYSSSPTTSDNDDNDDDDDDDDDGCCISSNNSCLVGEPLLNHLLNVASYRAPASPLLFLLLLDPYPPKPLRGAVHNLFLSLIVDLRFKSRFAAALGSVAYRPLSTLFCAGVGTEADTPLGFSVQILTTGSLVHALSDIRGAAALLESDSDAIVSSQTQSQSQSQSSCNNGNERSSLYSTFTLPISLTVARAVHANLLGASKEVKMLLQNTVNEGMLSALLYREGEHPLLSCLPAAPDDEFLDSRSTRHKRLPHICRDLQYIVETPGTGVRLLSQQQRATADNFAFFPAVWARLLRMGQSMNPLNRKASGGHVEYENRERWLDAFRLSLNLAGTRDALSETLIHAANYHQARAGVTNLLAALLSEIKYWLYREGLLETGLLPPGNSPSIVQRSTLHAQHFALDCATQVRILENQFAEVEHMVHHEPLHRWLRVPHNPYGGDPLSFHLPLHRAVAKAVLAMCAVPISIEQRTHDDDWWRIPIIDSLSLCSEEKNENDALFAILQHAVHPSNCIVAWNMPNEHTHARQCALATHIACAKVRHSLSDHPLRCIAASIQIERHLWPRNGFTVLQMAMHYGTLQLCRSFRDLDMLLVQLACGSGIGVGVGVGACDGILQLMLNRFSVEGYLCDPQCNDKGAWVKPRPFLQDADHAPVLAEALFVTLCHLVTELPRPPPTDEADTSSLEDAVRREVLHTLAAEPKSHSEALETAMAGVERRAGEAPTANFRQMFTAVLHDIATKKPNSNTSTPQWTLKNRADLVGEYDPTFWHLSRQEHQGAMDHIAGVRRFVFDGRKDLALPIVQAPPECHPRFASARGILHTAGIDAALRRFLLYCVCGGEWFPPRDPGQDGASSNVATNAAKDAAATNKKSKTTHPTSSNVNSNDDAKSAPITPTTISKSSISILEVLQLLTLQLHTIDCTAASNINDAVQTLLLRLVSVPSSLVDNATLSNIPTSASGANRASTLGLLVTLYEHHYHMGMTTNSSNTQTGARALVSSGLQWFLRAIYYLSRGAGLEEAKALAVSGKEFDTKQSAISGEGDELSVTIRDMLALPILWPSKPANDSESPTEDDADSKRKARKLAQLRAMERMKKAQASFAASMTASSTEGMAMQNEEEEEETCIICRCPGGNGSDDNGAGCLGYLGHMQGSRIGFLAIQSGDRSTKRLMQVVGAKGCQLRQQEDVASEKVALLPPGSIVSVSPHVYAENTVLTIHGRRLFVESVDDPNVRGYASTHMQSNVAKDPILLDLHDDRVHTSKWGYTRPVLKLCGHVAHTSCVEAHTLSLHQRNAADQSFDGRFAVNLEQGEFLCPLCKRLCNIVCPIVPPSKMVNKDQSPLRGMSLIQHHLLSNLARQNKDYIKHESTLSNFTRVLMTSSQLDGSPNLGLRSIILAGACLGHTAAHSSAQCKEIHHTIHPLIATKVTPILANNLSNILSGDSLSSLASFQLPYLAKQWCHVSAGDSRRQQERRQQEQWKIQIQHVLNEGQGDEVPSWLRGIRGDEAFASVWAHLPILTWDLTILTGIFFGTLPSKLENFNLALDIASILVTSRLIQVLTLPNAFDGESENKCSAASLELDDSDVQALQRLHHGNANLNLGAVTDAIAPFCQTICTLLQSLSVPLPDDVIYGEPWALLYHLGAQPSVIDVDIVEKWRRDVGVLENALNGIKIAIMDDDSKPRALVGDGYIEVDGDVSMGSPTSDEADSTDEITVVGFLSRPVFDISYLGLIRPSSGGNVISLISLPNSFVNLYSKISSLQLSHTRAEGNGSEESDEDESDNGVREIAICMVTGHVMLAGSSSRNGFFRQSSGPGQCTQHAERTGAGIGIFFLLHKCVVLLIHNNKSAYSLSLYVDEHGEEDVGLRRGRPLYLHKDRFECLQKLWSQHDVPREVAQIRSTSDRVIRDNWY